MRYIRADMSSDEKKPPESKPRSASDDILDSLLGPRKPPAGQQPAAPSDKTATGIMPVDLLTLPDAQRRALNVLTRKQQASFGELRDALGTEAEATQSLITTLREGGYINEAIVNGEIYYRIVFRGKVRRSTSRLPDDIWNRVDQDRLTFLRQVPLFQSLTEEELKSIADRMSEVRYQRDDVLLWQGRPSEQVYFIKSGIVGITRYSPQTREQKILAYMKQGEILGEYSVIAGSTGTASATASAMSNVSALMLGRADFIDLLNRHAGVALELARVLAQRLLAAGVRSSAQNANVILIIGLQAGVGSTNLGTALALTLVKETKQHVVYTELPDARRLAELFTMPADEDVFHHESGYDVMVAKGSAMLPASVRASLMLDQLSVQYENLIFGVPASAREVIDYLVSAADQIILVGTPEPEMMVRLGELYSELRKVINPEKVGLFSVINRSMPQHTVMHPTGRADFDLPYSRDFSPRVVQNFDMLPEAVARMTSTLADRLGRTNVVSLYIPTTIDVNTQVDTMPYVERTLAFLGKLFGGATTTQARGVWNSADAGLVGEDIHIVRSYATQTDLDSNLQKIMDYVEGLKQELRQEAMAVEINHKLMLI